MPFYLSTGEEYTRREKKIPDDSHEVASLLGPFCVIWFIACFLRVAFIKSYPRCVKANDIYTCTNPRTTVKCCLHNRPHLTNHICSREKNATLLTKIACFDGAYWLDKLTLFLVVANDWFE